MALAYLTEKACPAEAEVNEPLKVFEPTGETEEKRGGKMLFCFLSVTILFVLNTVYNFSVAAKGAPVLQTLIKNPVLNFSRVGKENPRLRNEAIRSIGVVTGILHSEDNPTALVGIAMVHEGEVISGAKVVTIHKDRVDFERDGFSWTQYVKEKAKVE